MLFGHSSYEPDLAKYAAWQPKIDAYRKKLEQGVLPAYKLADSDLPTQAELDKGIDVTAYAAKVCSDAELALTELSGTQLAAKIAAGEVSAVQALTAYAKRATVAHQLTNCAMELFVDEGMARARALDEHFRKNGTVVGPLHGLPVSLKEHYDYKGKVTHAAYVAWLDNVLAEHAQTVRDLEAQGAVFYVRTTQPQLLMHLCSANNITGRCRNPHNTALTPGGSSLGEGALAAMKGSVFGMGSDIGGSIRCPAAFCGVWGLRPLQKRVLMLGGVNGLVGQVEEAVYPVFGPLARCADDLDLFMSAVLGAEPWRTDPLVVPLAWRREREPAAAALKIAVVYDDGVVKPTPPILRALKTAVARLQAAGVTVVEWDNINVLALVEACYAGYNYDGNYAQKKVLAASGEPALALSQKHLTFGCGDAGLSGLDVQRLCCTRDAGRVAYMAQMNREKIDFILSPTYVSVAAKPETISYWGYTNLWNILDFPNVVFPCGMAVGDEDVADTAYVPRNDVEKYEYALYTGPEDFKGAPISLQLTGRRYEDEKVVQAAKVVQKIIAEGA